MTPIEVEARDNKMSMRMGRKKEVLTNRKQFNDKKRIDFPARLADSENDASE